MRKIQNNIFSIDPLITIIFLILVFIGFISIFSTQIQNDVVFFSFNNEAFKQLIWIIFSFVILISVFFLEHRFIYNLAVPLYVFSILLLIAVFFVGVESNTYSTFKIALISDSAFLILFETGFSGSKPVTSNPFFSK